MGETKDAGPFGQGVAGAIVRKLRRFHVPVVGWPDVRSLSGYTIAHAIGVKAKAHCPAGTRVLGGGGHEHYAYTFRVRDVLSVPLAHGAGWEYGMEAETGGWITTAAFAICATI